MYFLIKHALKAWKRRQAAAAERAGEPAGASAPRRGSRAGSARDHGWLGLLAHQARYDLLTSTRNPRARFFTIAFPIILLVIFSGVFGSSTTTVDGVHVSLSRFYVPGILALSIITASYGNLVINVTAARASGILKRRRATPVPASVVIGGQVAATLVTTTVMSVLLLVIAQIGYGIGFSGGAVLAIACAALVGTLAFSCLGYAVAGMISSPEAAQPVVQASLLPLYFISGVWIPTNSLPSGLRVLAEVFPIEHLAAGLHLASVRGSFSGAIAPKDLLVLALWGVAAAIFAGRSFSWMPAPRAA